MRETLHDNESLEAAARRGLREELGATAVMIDYLDSLRAPVPTSDEPFYKTTLYFLMRMQTLDLSKRSKNDPESGSEIIWADLDTAYDLLDKQAAQLPEDPDLHEAPVINWARRWITGLSGGSDG